MDVDPPTINNFLELKKYIDVGLEHFSGADLYYLNKDSFDFSKDVSDFPPTRTVTEHELFFRILDGYFVNKLKKTKLITKLTERLKIYYKVKSINASLLFYSGNEQSSFLSFEKGCKIGYHFLLTIIFFFFSFFPFFLFTFFFPRLK